MFTTLPLLGVLVLNVPVVQTRCEQVAPAPAGEVWARSPKQDRAVLLIHGYRVQLQDQTVARAELRGWQKPSATLVKELAPHADVFAFAYGQDVPIDTIVARSTLRSDVARIRRLGYRDIVLVGYSAGGIIARHFVEDYPDDGVTKVVQLAAPNGGTAIANLFGPSKQRAFLDCLTEDGRQRCLKTRSAKHVPDAVQFVCIVCRRDHLDTDSVVPCAAQWTVDLQEQCIPATLLNELHREAPWSAAAARLIAELVRQEQPRWDKERVDRGRKEILGK